MRLSVGFFGNFSTGTARIPPTTSSFISTVGSHPLTYPIASPVAKSGDCFEVRLIQRLAESFFGIDDDLPVFFPGLAGIVMWFRSGARQSNGIFFLYQEDGSSIFFDVHDFLMVCCSWEGCWFRRRNCFGSGLRIRPTKIPQMRQCISANDERAGGK